MTHVRAEKVKRVQNNIPELEPEYNKEGDLLIVGWGGTYGSLHSAVRKLASQGYKIGHAHFNYINPLPRNTQEVLGNFKKVIVCELNKGQLASVLRSNFNDKHLLQYNKVMGLPFSVTDLVKKFKNILDQD
jgi:2-oxoglutarate ferredoxin oxidoreductase subunit alpha